MNITSALEASEWALKVISVLDIDGSRSDIDATTIKGAWAAAESYLKPGNSCLLFVDGHLTGQIEVVLSGLPFSPGFSDGPLVSILAKEPLEKLLTRESGNLAEAFFLPRMDSE